MGWDLVDDVFELLEERFQELIEDCNDDCFFAQIEAIVLSFIFSLFGGATYSEILNDLLDDIEKEYEELFEEMRYDGYFNCVQDVYSGWPEAYIDVVFSDNDGKAEELYIEYLGLMYLTVDSHRPEEDEDEDEDEVEAEEESIEDSDYSFGDDSPDNDFISDGFFGDW